MKKNLLFMTMLFGVLFLLPISAKALTGTVTIECAKSSISAGESTTCTIYATPSDGNSTGIGGKYTVTDGLSISKFELKNGAITDVNTDESSFDYVLNDETNSKYAFGVITVTAKSDATVSEQTISLTDLNIYDDAANPNKIALDNATTKINIVEKQTETVPENKQKGKGETNPKTADSNILLYTGIIVAAATISVVCYRKYKKIK